MPGLALRNVQEMRRRLGNPDGDAAPEGREAFGGGLEAPERPARAEEDAWQDQDPGEGTRGAAVEIRAWAATVAEPL